MVEGDTYMILRVRSWGGEAKISVEDNGPGLSEEARSRLFEPFFSMCFYTKKDYTFFLNKKIRVLV